MDSEERIVRLAKPIKKGLLRLVFSRFFVIALLLVVQVAIAVVAYIRFSDKIHILLYIQWAFVFVMIVFLFNSSMDASAKLTWMLIIALLPLAGALMLLFTQSNVGHRKETDFISKQIEDTRHMLAQQENVFRRVERDGSGTDDLCKYLNLSGCFPLYDRTQVTYFPLGENKFEAMLEEL